MEDETSNLSSAQQEKANAKGKAVAKRVNQSVGVQSKSNSTPYEQTERVGGGWDLSYRTTLRLEEQIIIM